MSLHPIRPADDEHRVVQHLQCPLHLRRKVNVTGRVQQCHLGVRQGELRLLGENCDAAFALERKRIEERILMVHAA